MEHFGWDDAKAVANVDVTALHSKRRVRSFKDPFALDWLDGSEDYGEDRFAVLGMAEGRLLYVGYTMRGESIRIISARLAEPFERRRYHEESEP